MMSCSFKLCPTYFSRGAKNLPGGFVPCAPLVTGLESIKNWFQLIYLNLSWVWYCIRLPCVYDFEISCVSVRDYSFNSTHMSCNLVEFCTDFLQWFRSNSFAYFSFLPWRSNISIRSTLETINKLYSFSENDSKHEITLGKSGSCLYRSNNFCHL